LILTRLDVRWGTPSTAIFSFRTSSTRKISCPVAKFVFMAREHCTYCAFVISR